MTKVWRVVVASTKHVILWTRLSTANRRVQHASTRRNTRDVKERRYKGYIGIWCLHTRNGDQNHEETLSNLFGRVQTVWNNSIQSTWLEARKVISNSMVFEFVPGPKTSSDSPPHGIKSVLSQLLQLRILLRCQILSRCVKKRLREE